MANKVELKEDFLLNENSRVPFYYQVKQHFKKKIDSGEWKAGEMLPYESQLCKRLNISRIVVRQAYQELKNDGYITSKKGKGTFISEPKIYTNWMQNFLGFYENMKNLGYDIKNTILEQKMIKATKEVAQALQLNKDDKVNLIKRLHNVNGEPFYLSTNYLPYRLFPDLISEKLDMSIYKVLEKKYGLEIIKSRRYLDGGTATAEEAGYLKIDEGDFVFRIESLSFLRNNIPFEYFNSTHIGKQTRLIIDIVKNGSCVQMGKVD